jgi:hypothetical protein
MKTITLNDGIGMPVRGLGVFQAPLDEPAMPLSPHSTPDTDTSTPRWPWGRRGRAALLQSGARQNRFIRVSGGWPRMSSRLEAPSPACLWPPRPRRLSSQHLRQCALRALSHESGRARSLLALVRMPRLQLLMRARRLRRRAARLAAEPSSPECPRACRGARGFRGPTMARGSRGTRRRWRSRSCTSRLR